MSLLSARLSLRPALFVGRNVRRLTPAEATEVVEQDRIAAIQAAVRWLADNGHRPAAEAFESFLLAPEEEP